VHEGVGVLRNSFCSFMHIMGCWGAAGGGRGARQAKTMPLASVPHLLPICGCKQKALPTVDTSQEACTRQAVSAATQQRPPSHEVGAGRDNQIGVPKRQTEVSRPTANDATLSTAASWPAHPAAVRASITSSQPRGCHVNGTLWAGAGFREGGVGGSSKCMCLGHK
jgi:hypothetical protein